MIFRRVFGAALLLCLFSGSASQAAPAVMPIGHPTKQPFGHFAYCQEQPRDCAPLARDDIAGPINLTSQLVRLVADVNSAVNTQIKPASDQALYGREEYWTLPDKSGDCEDFALLKRARLHAAGIPLSDLLVTVVRKRDGTGHAILTLRTRQGDFVLDNLDWRVLSWRDAPYEFLKRQSSEDPGLWVEIESSSDPVVSAVTP
ncbi:transglutaminase-like cysteine peptidase [Aureimonas jatrophae]|uniref:Predicted transglutaminase-like cysteine proteinase n=1 Tax=Aureimonas jatrophae TaxID=1166073 RepID=A0A1H0CA75_9HYPH|nr:transglutaminase-like cysteine peptidase [Aureimonas jatrophae]MBB3949137.1 putative transglutaminase-like cysteine proteinase [Aureimonas jatrophae]SDN54711.1 Predicted transglutaminase-like cysteine proteinase [Aureimonas jatrophae]